MVRSWSRSLLEVRQVTRTQVFAIGVLDSDQRDRAVEGDRSGLDGSPSPGAQRAGRIAGGADFRKRCNRVLDSRDVGPRPGGVEEGRTLIARREHDVCSEPHRRGVRLGQQCGGLVGVQAGRLEGVLEVTPEGGRGGDDEERE